VEALVKAGFNRGGSQKYKCKRCHRITTLEPNANGYDEKTKALATRMVLEGNSFASTGRVLEVNSQSVANWVKAHAQRLPDTPAKPSEPPEQIELDELFTFVGSKKTGYISSRLWSAKHGVS
jgi:hypothetical protein